MRATTREETSDLKSILVGSQTLDQQEKEGGLTMIDTILKFKGFYRFCHVALILFCLGYLTNSCCENYQPINVVPIYKIKAVDPLEILKGVGSPSDRAEY